MRCDDVAVNLPDYILGKIEPNLRKCIEAHLDGCAGCRAELEEMRDPIRILGEVGYEEYPDAFWQELHASIMESVSKPAPLRWKVPAFAGAIAVVLLAVGVGIFEFSSHPAQPELNSLAALTTSLPPEQAVTLPSLNINYVDVVSSQANELDEMGAVDDSVQQAVVSALWNSISDSTISVDAVDYLGNTFSN
jgi:anti-sigma factor RsiW